MIRSTAITATRRYNSTDAAPTSPKIEEIVNQISQLTLLETADLVASLKVRLTSRLDRLL
jgi:large subunit ribosomal protein L7/L12